MKVDHRAVKTLGEVRPQVVKRPPPGRLPGRTIFRALGIASHLPPAPERSSIEEAKEPREPVVTVKMVWSHRPTHSLSGIRFA
jgi:hypothetical protein